MKRVLLFLKDGCIPHPKNAYHPYILRNKALIFYSVFLIVAQLCITTLGSQTFQKNITTRITPDELIQLANAERVKEHLSELRQSPALEIAAQEKARDMRINDYFSHDSPSNITPWYWIKQRYEYVYAGENLAMDFLTSSGVHEAWLKSPTHRANILSEHFKEIGIAVVPADINGKHTTIVVQMFGQNAKDYQSTLAEKEGRDRGYEKDVIAQAKDESKKADKHDPEYMSEAKNIKVILLPSLLHPNTTHDVLIKNEDNYTIMEASSMSLLSELKKTISDTFIAQINPSGDSEASFSVNLEIYNGEDSFVQKINSLNQRFTNITKQDEPQITSSKNGAIGNARDQIIQFIKNIVRAFLVFLSGALLLKIVWNIKKQHPRVVVMALLLIAAATLILL